MDRPIVHLDRVLQIAIDHLADRRRPVCVASAPSLPNPHTNATWKLLTPDLYPGIP
jgi:hypothetical protein